MAHGAVSLTGVATDVRTNNLVISDPGYSTLGLFQVNSFTAVYFHIGTSKGRFKGLRVGNPGLYSQERIRQICI